MRQHPRLSQERGLTTLLRKTSMKRLRSSEGGRKGAVHGPCSNHKPRLIGGHQVRPPPGPPTRTLILNDPPSGTVHWMRNNGTPPRRRGNRAKEIWRLCRQWITAAEVIDVAHYNHKTCFEVRFQNASYQVRARQTTQTRPHSSICSRDP